MQDYYTYPEGTPTVEYSYADIANYLPNDKLPPITLEVDSTSVVIFAVKNGKFSHYCTSHHMIELLFGVTAENFLHHRKLCGLTGWVVYRPAQSFVTYNGSWNHAAAQMTKDFPAFIK